jgi:hypothetical protein
MRRIHASLLLLPLLGFGLTSAFLSAPEPLEFERATLILEHNATDGDAEIVLDLASDEDLTRLELRGPQDCDGEGGRKILAVRSRRSLEVGLSQILIETGEPAVQPVLDAFPEGTYELKGRTLDGRPVRGTVDLTHDLLPAPQILFPPDGDKNIPAFGLVIEWAPDPSASSWLMELEREDDLPGQIVATLPAGSICFAVPDGFLVPGVEYQVGVRAISKAGNVTVSEHTFVTQ